MSRSRLDEVMLLDAEFWFRTCGKIRDKSAEIVTPVPNVMQTRMFRYYRECQAKGVPCLMMTLKPRQKGASTITELLVYHHLRRYPELKGFLMGDVQGTSDKVFEIFRLAAEKDRFPWGGVPGVDNVMPGLGKTDEITLVNGSKWYKETAGSPNAGRGGTVQVAHFDEEAWYPRSTKRDPMLAALPSVNKLSPKSLVIRTSTPNGAEGTFYDDWFSVNPYKKIFAAWFEFDDSIMLFESEDERAAFADSLSDDERLEMRTHKGKVSLEHLKWRRFIIETECKGDVDRFRQEYPSDEISCFLLSARLRYDANALREMKGKAESNDKVKKGSLVVQPDSEGVLWVPDPEGDVRLFEDPRLGCYYLVSVDTCSGEDQQIGKTPDPDYHDAQVWRRGYFDPARGLLVPPKMVMRHRSRVDSDILVEIVRAMSLYYGKCIIIPEVNGEAGLHLIKMLVAKNMPVYKRRNSVDGEAKTEYERLEAYGWRTTTPMRKMIVDSMVAPIRQKEIDFSDVEIIEEFERFIVKRDGKAEGMRGFHDDAVISACIGHYCLPSATEYRQPYRRQVDLSRLRRDPSYMAPDGFKRDIQVRGRRKF